MTKRLSQGPCTTLFTLLMTLFAYGLHAQQLTEYRVGDVTFNMVTVQGGTFTMGATPEQDTPYHDEFPSHYVTLHDFAIGQTEVTQQLWVAVMGTNPSEHVGPTLPVDRVSWIDCQRFIHRLDSITGLSFRLPTEAEWEFAARGGNAATQTQFAGSNELREVAWYYNNSGDNFLTSTNWNFQQQLDNHCGTHPVATSRPNELGIYDMSGNLWEWCQDWYINYQPGDAVNPSGPKDGLRRVARGGSWAHISRYCRVSRRTSYNPSQALNVNGLRLAL